MQNLDDFKKEAGSLFGGQLKKVKESSRAFKTKAPGIRKGAASKKAKISPKAYKFK